MIYIFHSTSKYVETYSRFDESHFQRTFDERHICSVLVELVLEHVETFTDFNIDEHNEDA